MLTALWSVFILCVITQGCTAQLLFPHGTAEGDTLLAKGDDGNSGEIVISTNFSLFGVDYKNLYVNINGAVSFSTPINSYSPEPFPLDDNRAIIAPFWTDIDTSYGMGHGDVMYRQLLLTNQTTELFERVNGIVRNVSTDRDTFKATWMFIATWSDVAYYDALDPSELLNTFQCVLLTDGDYCGVIMIYNDITWTGQESAPEKNAQAGFDAGDGTNYYMIESSRTPEIIDIETKSNMGQPGMWLFRVDGLTIMDAACENAEQLTISPRTLPMLGGTSVIISGKCFKQSTRDIECAFGIYRVKGYLTTTNSVTCVTPAMFVSGVIDVRLSLDGGSIFSYVGTVVVGDEISPVTFKTDPDGNLTITWDPAELPDVDEVDVLVYEISSDANVISWEAINTTTWIYSSEPGRLGINIHAYPQRDVGEMSPIIGALGILARDETNSSIERRGIWSAIQPLNWLYPVNLTSWCQSWITRELTELNEWLPQRPACPCTERQARRDIGSFTVFLDCRHGEAEENCSSGRTDAMLCVISNIPSVSGAGQECCYDNAGHLIEFDGNGAGFSQRQHQRVTSPNPISGLGPVPILSHYLTDTVPYLQCCAAEGRDEQRFCELYRRVRPPNNCYSYQPPKPASAFGDPHFITFDGLNYTFNGYGEFTLANVDENEFILQARSLPMKETPNATIFTAVATKSNGSDVIHVEANGTFGTSVFFRREGRQCFEEADFTLRRTWYLRGVTVRAEENLAVDGISISFDNGIAVKLTARNDALALFVTVTHRFKFHTQGMLGTWNDDQSDDLQRPDDVSIPVTSSMETIFYEFGNLWRVKRNESLFFYRTGYSYSSYANYNYTPSFERPTFSMDDRVSHVCGDDQLCAFDFAVSGSEGFASQTLYTISQFKSTSSDLLPLTCPSLLLPNGRVITTSSSPGSLAKFSCDSCYIRRGPANTTCASDGTWLQPLASCIPIELQCETPVAPSHGHVMVGGCPITYATFTCKGGYDLVGTSMVQCLHDGFWSHPIPKCESKGINMETMKLNSVHAAAIGGGAAAFVLILCLIIACLVTKQRDKRRKQALKKRLSNRWSTTRNPLYDPNASNS